MKQKLLRSLTAVGAAEGLLVAIGLGLGAENLWPGTALFAFSAALYVPTILDRIRRVA